MRTRALLLCFLAALAAPLRAADPVHLLPKFEAALKEIRGPLAFVAGNLGRLDYAVKDGQANPETLRVVRPMLAKLENRGFSDFEQILMVKSAKARQAADGAVESYLYAAGKSLSREEARHEAGEILLDRRQLLPEGYEEALRDLVRDDAQKVAEFEKRRPAILRHAREIADRLAPARSEDSSSAGELDSWTLQKVEVVNFILKDGMTAAGENVGLQRGVDELMGLLEAHVVKATPDPVLKRRIVEKAFSVLQSCIDALKADEGFADNNQARIGKAESLKARLRDGL